MIVESSDSFDNSMELSELERMIGHMEVDLSYHQSQTRFFEKKVMQGQKTLKILRRKSDASMRPHRHSHCDETHAHHDEEEDHEM